MVKSGDLIYNSDLDNDTGLCSRDFCISSFDDNSSINDSNIHVSTVSSYAEYRNARDKLFEYWKAHVN